MKIKLLFLVLYYASWCSAQDVTTASFQSLLSSKVKLTTPLKTEDFEAIAASVYPLIDYIYKNKTSFGLDSQEFLDVVKNVSRAPTQIVGNDTTDLNALLGLDRLLNKIFWLKSEKPDQLKANANTRIGILLRFSKEADGLKKDGVDRGPIINDTTYIIVNGKQVNLPNQNVSPSARYQSLLDAQRTIFVSVWSSLTKIGMNTDEERTNYFLAAGLNKSQFEACRHLAIDNR